MTWRLVPPIAIPLGVGDAAGTLLAGGPDGDLKDALRESFPGHLPFVFGEGRIGLARLLAAWATPERNEVAVPAYTCWSVPASVVHAGLRVRPYDIDPETLDVAAGALDALDARRSLAVVGAHLFARTVDVDALVSNAAALDPAIRVVEDAAQAWPLPTSPADALLLSFGRGKPLPIGGGGAVLLRESSGGDTPAARALAAAAVPAPGGWRARATLFATVALSRPLLYRVPASIPALGLGRTIYDPGFPDDVPFFQWQDRLGRRLLARLDALTRERLQNAQRLADALPPGTMFRIPPRALLGAPLRLPLLAPDRARRDAALAALLARGVSATAMYPGTLHDVPGLAPQLAGADRPCPGARAVADRLLTVPCYPGLSDGDLERIASALRSL